MMLHRRSQGIIAGLTLAIIGAACTPALASDPAELVTAPARVSPLQEYLDLLWGVGLDQETQLREHEAQQVRREELIAECMAAQGFKYLPHLDSVTMEFQSDELRLDDPSWVSQWGYGLASGLSLGANMEPGLTVVTSGGYFGPNETLLAELTDAERSAWLDAFTGNLFDADGNFDESRLEIPTCRTQASMQAIREFDPQFDQRRAISDQFEPLITEINGLRGEVNGWWGHTPFISDADRDWAACMADAGYSRFTRQFDAQRTVGDMLNSFMPLVEDWDAATPANTPRLAEILELEIDIAMADLSCRIATDYRARQDAALTELETQFIADHREALTALRSALEQLS